MTDKTFTLQVIMNTPPTGFYFDNASIESLDRVVMLERLGWSRGGNTNHLPDDIIGVIKDFTFFDTRTEEYREHLKREQNKYDMYWVLDDMMFKINNGLNRYKTGEYGVEYNPINTSSNCCTRCGDFVPVWDPLPENIRCKCKFMTEEETMELEYQFDDYHLWKEEEEEEEERSIQSRKSYAQFMEEMNTERAREEKYDNYFSDRNENWIEEEDYDYERDHENDYKDVNSYY
jgi:hypothetical protein